MAQFPNEKVMLAKPVSITNQPAHETRIGHTQFDRDSGMKLPVIASHEYELDPSSRTVDSVIQYYLRDLSENEAKIVVRELTKQGWIEPDMAAKRQDTLREDLAKIDAEKAKRKGYDKEPNGWPNGIGWILRLDHKGKYVLQMFRESDEGYPDVEEADDDMRFFHLATALRVYVMRSKMVNSYLGLRIEPGVIKDSDDDRTV